MIGFVKWLHLVGLAVWLGSIVFFSFAVAPQVFGVLPRPDAGRVVSAIFPIYYYFGYAGGIVTIATALMLRSADARASTWTVAAAVAALMLAITLYAGLIVQPRAHALRTTMQDAPESSTAKMEFDRLHRNAVRLNGSVLLGVLILTGFTASRMRP